MSVFNATIDLPDEAATIALAEDVAAMLAPGDVVALRGSLGAGKTTFARGLLRAVADESGLEVPSPTFTLVQAYSGRLPIAHFDLYRLGTPDELDEIGFEDALGEGAALVEWPERAEARLPRDRLDILLTIEGSGRRALVGADGPLADRLARSRAVRAFLDRSGWWRSARRHLQGDASTRIYERVHRGGDSAVLMNWQARPEGPPVKDGRSYDAIAHRTRDVGPFIAIDEALRSAGFSAPEIYASDPGQGFLLLEDFGADGIVKDGAPDPERYAVAVDLLAALHSQKRQADLPVSTGGHWRLPPYDRDALLIEAELLAEWYAPHVTGDSLSATARDEFTAIWSALLDRLAGAEQNWVLRDVHSPNLLWLREREGIRRIGLIDFQDALFGPSAYDVASLLQDARVTVPPDLESALRDRYIDLRRRNDPRFDAQDFITSYAIAGAQRATKVIGIFTRLAVQSGKAGYLRHLSRLGEYLRRNFAHPVLSPYRLWYEKHLPPTE
jgi:tRNA threonylcarbamoyl adenosine modification protein YjeE